MVPPFLERDGPAMCWLAGRGPDQGERVWSAVSESGKPHPNLAPQHQYPNTNTNTPNTHKYPTPPLSTRWGGFRVDHTGGTSEHLPSTSRPGGSGKVRAPRGGKEGRRERRNVPPPAICPSVHLSICLSAVGKTDSSCVWPRTYVVMRDHTLVRLGRLLGPRPPLREVQTLTVLHTPRLLLLPAQRICSRHCRRPSAATPSPWLATRRARPLRTAVATMLWSAT